jgi:monoterpene epsilon-lactone hydrolase
MPSLQARVTRVLMRRMLRPYLMHDSLHVTRARFATLAPPVRAVPALIEPTSLRGVPAEWLTARDVERARVLYYLHGGGFVACSPATHRRLVARIAGRAGVRALLPDYRLAPEHPYPSALDDCVAGYEHLLELGHTPGQIVIAGDSAGGALTLGTLLCLRDRGLPLPAGAVLLSPATDATLSGGSFVSRADDDALLSPDFCRRVVAAYLPDAADRHGPYASPLLAELAGLPPLLIQVGTHEILHDDATRFAERARAAGVDVTLEVWDGMWHVFQMFEAPESKRAVERIAEFVRTRTAVPG